MDKIATNNFIVTLRRDVKASKSMVAGNLTRKIAEIKKKIEATQDEDHKAKMRAKIDKIHGQIKLLKTLEEYPICKSAMLKPDPKYWDKMISDSQAPIEDILRARVISKGKIQKQVDKFRSEHKDCDEWLEEYFEFREKKRELIVAKKSGWKPRKPNQKSTNDGGGGGAEKKGKFEKPFNKFSKRTTKPARGTRKNSMGDNSVDGGDRIANKSPKPPRQEQQHQQQQKRPAQANRGPPISKDKRTNKQQEESLHPSWASKRREKDLLKAALSGKVEQPKRIVLNKEND